LLAGVLELPPPPQDVMKKRPKIAMSTTNHFKRLPRTS
jgi:hypothetical protein